MKLSVSVALLVASLTPINAQFDDIVAPFDYSAPLTGSSRCAMVNIAMDESGSMQREQKFMEEYAIPRLSNLLYGPEYQYDHVFFCTNGFGWLHAPAPYFFRHIGCTIGVAGTATGLVDSSVTAWQNTQGGRQEDGYHAIVQAINSVPAMVPGLGSMIDIASTCATIKNNIILVTDEVRNKCLLYYTILYTCYIVILT